MKPGAEPIYPIFFGSAMEGPAYRVVRRCPPSAEDFLSYVAAGRGFNAKMFFQATGVSMWAERRQAEKLARGGTVGTCVATVELDADFIYVTPPSSTGHITVWAPSRLLANRVLECQELGEGGI